MSVQFGLLGRKIGMTQVFNPDGSRLGVTAVEIGPCHVVQKRTDEKDGYVALQLGFDEKPERLVNNPMGGHFKKSGVAPQRVLVEFRVSQEVADQYEVGQTITSDVFENGAFIDVSGLSKGKGFAGVMKRWGYRGGKATHGVHEVYRHGGSLGQCTTPGRVIKGKRMAGHQGNSKVTVQNLKIVRMFPQDNLIFIKGPVPGSRGSLLTIAPAVKKR